MAFKAMPIEIKPGHPLYAQLTRMIAQAPGVTPVIELHTCESRFLVVKGSQLVCCCRNDPKNLVRDPAFPEGDYLLFSFCSCCPNGSSEAVPFGTMRCYGDGIGAVRRIDGQVWSTDMD